MKRRHCTGVVKLLQGQTQDVHADAAASDIQHHKYCVWLSVGPHQTKKQNKTEIPFMWHSVIQRWPLQQEPLQDKVFTQTKRRSGKNQTMGTGDVEASGQLVCTCAPAAAAVAAALGGW